jgi:ADP-ribose pyrophosphatase YjhB (NUDIX family)
MEYWQRLRQAVGQDTLIISGAAGAIVKDGKILLARHGDFKKWHIPGGLQEVGESIEQTVRREIREELGLNLEPTQLISVLSSPKWRTEFPNGDKIQKLLFFFKMEGELTPLNLQDSEITACDFFAFDAIPEDTMDCCKQKVLDLLEYRGQTLFR